MPAKVSPTIRRIQLVGGMIFLVSFLLPAIRIQTSFDFGPESLRGYQCMEWSARLLYHSFRMLLPHSGAYYMEPWTLGFILGISLFINPLVLCYLLTNSKWRRRVAILICVLFLETWFAMSLNHFVPLIGHFLWVAGILLMLAPEVSAWEDGSAS
jgi:hypothetical protein